MPFNPLVLGEPYGSSTSLSTSDTNINSTSNLHLPGSPSSPTHLSPIPEPSETAATLSETPSNNPDTTSTPNQPSTSPPPPDMSTISAIRSAPTSFPVSPVAHQAGTAGDRPPQDVARMLSNDSDKSSSSATLNGSNGNVPLSAGGLHGQPLPGPKRAAGEIPEKDHQAAGMGGRTGPEIAALAEKELGLSEVGEYDEKHTPLRSPRPVGKANKLERTDTGSKVAHPGSDGLRGFAPITRQTSQAPGVGPFGGCAPSGPDAEEGRRAARTHEEEEERELERQKNGPDPWAVRFDPGEKANPKNWGVLYRWFLTALAGLLVLNSTFASSAPSGIVTQMEEYFGFSQEVGVLTIALFVAGYCIGPLLWGPLSESLGRRPVFIGTFVAYMGFQIGCALSKNTASILIFRFLGGCFASAPLTNSGALIADIWDTDHRGQAMSLFALAPFAGPSIGPIVAGFIGVSGTSWRWVYWILTIFSGVCLAIIILFVPETYSTQLLLLKAKKLRKTTGEQRWYAPLERTDHSFKARLNSILLKPFIMLGLEPMLLAVTLYMSFVYGVVYLLFEAFPFVFIVNHGFNTGEEGLAFLGFFAGGLTSVVLFMTVIEPRFQRHAAKVHPAPPKPEKRLELCIIAGWTLVIAMFWFAWTSFASIHWISPLLAGALMGFSVLGMFVSLFNYIIDVYLWAAASALAGTTVCRSVAGAAFPTFANQMYAKLGTQWASSLLGFLALLMAPIPLVLYRFGPALRQRSRFSPNKAS